MSKIMRGFIVVITRNGSLGGRYPLTSTECLFGKSPKCDVRVYVANVAREHCLIIAPPNETAYIRNLSPSNTTLVNGIQIGATKYELQHADVVTVGDRHFRWEYPENSQSFKSNQKTPAKKIPDSEMNRSPTCMVQVPMSVFKKKRHSSPGVLHENKIISFTSEDMVEPDPKRRKTLHSVTDLGMDNKWGKPVNKQLLAVTQPASSPKSFKTFKVLLKSASKRKSSMPKSKTPKPQKKVISSRVNRSKSHSPQKMSPKNEYLLKKCQVEVVKISKSNTPQLKSATKTPSLAMPQRKMSAKQISPEKNSSAKRGLNMTRKSIAAVPLKDTQILATSPKNSPKNRRKSIAFLKSYTPPKLSRNTPLKTSKNTTPRKFVSQLKSSSKTGTPNSGKILTLIISPLPQSSSQSPLDKNKRNGRTPKSLKSSPFKISPPLKKSPMKNVLKNESPRGSPSKKLYSPTKKSVSPVKSSTKTILNITPGKLPRGRPSKTNQPTNAQSSSVQSTSFAKSPSNILRSNSPVKNETPGKTPRGRPKTPRTLSAKLDSPAKTPYLKTSRSVSPIKKKTPGRPPKTSPTRSPSPTKPLSNTSRSASPDEKKTPGKPPKTPQTSPPRSASPTKSPSNTSRSASPDNKKTPGKPRKTPQTSPIRSTSPIKSPSVISISASPENKKTPGRPKNPQTSPTRSVSPTKTPSNTSRSASPEKKKTPGRPRKTPQTSPTRSISPTKTPSNTSRNASPEKKKTPGRPPKTPQTSPTRSVSPIKSPPVISINASPEKKTPGRPRKTPQTSPTRSASPSKTPSNTSRSASVEKKKTPGRPPKTPQSSHTRSTSPTKTPSNTSRNASPEKKKTPGRPPKTPQTSPTRSDSPIKSTPVISINASPEKKTPGRPRKTPQTSPTRSASPSKTPSNTSRSASVEKKKTPSRPPKTPQSSPTRSVSPTKSLSNSLMSASLVENITPVMKPRGRPSKISQASPTRLNTPTKTPQNTSRSISAVEKKTPGRPPKTPPQQSVSPNKSPSHLMSSNPLVKNQSPGKKLRGRPSKTPQASPIRTSDSAKSPTNMSVPKDSQEDTPDTRLRGRPKTPQVSPTRSPSPVKSLPANTSISSPLLKSQTPGRLSKTHETVLSTSPGTSPEKNKTPKTTPRGRPSKTPQAFPTRRVVSPPKSPSPKISHDDSSTEANSPKLVVNKSFNESIGKFESNVTDVNLTKSARRSALRSGLSSSKNATATNKPLLLKSSTKKAEIAKLQIDSKRKYDTEAEAKAERAAKRLKMETPKSLTKNKKAAILVCHSPKSQKRPLFSEVLKSHLSTAKKNQAAAAAASVAARKVAKQIYQHPPALEVPKSFKFNSTGHANSPETIVIRKKVKATPLPKTRKGRKSIISAVATKLEDKNLEGVSELFKTPKSIISSLKSASSVKKPQNTRVRFSLQNDVQSPSGRRSLVKQSDEVTYFGSPMVPSKKYTGTPRPALRRISDTSLIHTSIMEESPLAKEINTSGVSTDSFDFTAYSPSSPTLQFSRISGVSSIGARKSIDFFDSPESESPKRKRSLITQNDSLVEPSPSSLKRFSFGSVKSNRSIRSSTEFQPSPDNCARLSHSLGSPEKSNLSQGSRQRKSSSRILSDSEYTEASAVNISQIPLPPSSAKRQTLPTSSSLIKFSDSETSMRSTRSSKSNITSETPLIDSPRVRRSTDELESSKVSKITSPCNSERSKTSQKSSRSINSSSSYDSDASFAELPKRISSTPKVNHDSTINSPVGSPISILDSRSLRSLGSPGPQNYTVESSKSSPSTFKTPLPTPGKKSRKGSTRMSASNTEINTPESQVPIATVKPSTRKKGNESYSSVAESVSLPTFSLSHDISERSMDRSLAQKMLDSRSSSILGQIRTSRNITPSFSGDQSNLSLGSLNSSRRKRKSSAYTSIQSLDATTFDFTSAMTPKIPREMFVSPLEQASDDLTNLSGVKRILNPKGNSPVSSYVDVTGIKKLLKTPKAQNDLTDVAGVKRVMSPRGNSPISSYIDVKGVKRLLKTPQPSSPLANYASIEGIKELFKKSPVADYTNVAGVKTLYSASVEPNYMNVKGVRRIFKETKVPNSPDIAGVEVLFESPKKLGEEYHQSPSNKPVGMVPPMTRQVSSTKTSGLSATGTNDFNPNESVTETSTQMSSRRRISTSQAAPVTDNQARLKTSVLVSRRGKHTNADSKITPAIEVIHIEDDNEVNEDSTNNTRNPVNQVIGSSPNTKPKVGRKTRQVLQEENLAPKEGDQSESEKKTRGRLRQKTKQEDRIKTPSPPQKSKRLKKQDIDNAITSSLDIAESGRSVRSRRGKVNQKEELQEPSKIVENISEEPRGRGRPGKPKALEDNSKSLDVKSTSKGVRNRIDNPLALESENMSKTTSMKRKTDSSQDNTTELLALEKDSWPKSKKENQNVLSEPSTSNTSPLELKAQTTTKRRVQFNMKSSSTPEKSNKKKATVKTTVSTRAPSTTRGAKAESPSVTATSPKTEPAKRKTRGKDTLKTVSKAESPSVTATSPKTEPAKRKTRGKDTLKTVSKAESPSVTATSPKTEPAKRKTRGKDTLKADTVSKAQSPVPTSTSPKREEPARRTRAKASPKLKTSPKKESPSPKKKTPVKRVTKKMKASPKLKATPKKESPSPKNKTPVKKVATKTKASPKLKAATKLASPTVSSSSSAKKEPAKRKTRAKVSPVKETVTKAASPVAKSAKSKAPTNKVSAKAKASPTLEVAAKAASPVAKSAKSKAPTKKVSAKAKASPTLKAAAKVASPKVAEPKKKAATKQVTAKTKASPKTKDAVKVASPKKAEPKKKGTSKNVTVKTKASPKLKAAAKRKSSTPAKSPPARRVTRARK